MNEIRINEVSWFLNVDQLNGKSYKYYGDSKYILEISSLHSLLTIINNVLAYDGLTAFLSLAVVLECLNSLSQDLAILRFGMLKISLPRLMISKDLLVLRSSVQASGWAIDMQLIFILY